jgi:hypothetical protein
MLRGAGGRTGGGQRQHRLGGLVIPHLARLLVGADHRRLLPTAFWLGGGFMIVVDDLARTLTRQKSRRDHHRVARRPAVYLAAGPLTSSGWSDEHVASLAELRYGHRQPLFARSACSACPVKSGRCSAPTAREKHLLDTLTGVLHAARRVYVQAVAIVPQSFRPAFNWQVRRWC